MKKYIGKRIISFLIVLVGVSILSFLLIAWSGKDPAEIIAHRGVSNPTPEQIEMIRVEMGLDQPLPVRYIQWLSGMFTGELGTSLTYSSTDCKRSAQVSGYDHISCRDGHSMDYRARPFRLVCSVPESGTAFSIRLPEALLSAVFVCQLSGWDSFFYCSLRFICKWFQCLTKSRLEGLFTTFTLPWRFPSSCSLIRIMRSSTSRLNYLLIMFGLQKPVDYLPTEILVCHILRNGLTACCYNFLSAIRLSNCRRGGNRKCFFNQGNRNLSGGQCDCSRYDCSFYLYSRHCSNFCRRKFHGRHNQSSALSMDGEGRK